MSRGYAMSPLWCVSDEGKVVSLDLKGGKKYIGAKIHLIFDASAIYLFM